MPKAPAKRSIVVEKIEPARCAVCKSTDVQYGITCRERSDDWPSNRPVDIPRMFKLMVNKHACKDHLLQVTEMAYIQAGFVTDPVTEQLVKENTDERSQEGS